MNNCFYKEGLRFECKRCSSCCRFDPGYVFLSYRDLDRLVEAGGVERKEFLQLYCRAVYMNGVYRLSLKEKKNFDCIFWEDGGCRLYEARPLQCRSFPFWSDYIKKQGAWMKLEASCPGINHGPIHSKEEIEGWVKLREKEPLMVVSPADLTILQKEPV